MINGWSVVYEKAIRDDGTLLFPERLTKEFLEKARRTMGSYLFANQYQNEIIPSDEQTFKPHWNRYHSALPKEVYHFGFIDPAISEADTADYSGIVVVAVDGEQNWYVRYATRLRINPSELIDMTFRLCDQFQIKIMGIEDVAFQKALIHFAHEEMKRRNRYIPLQGVKRGTDVSKETRILGLVPRFEWGTLFLSQGLHDLELELAEFPRGSHDDLIDALSSISQIAYYPPKPRSNNDVPTSPNHPEYEKRFIERLLRKANQSDS